MLPTIHFIKNAQNFPVPLLVRVFEGVHCQLAHEYTSEIAPIASAHLQERFLHLLLFISSI
jgi:hypothetical protein